MLLFVTDSRTDRAIRASTNGQDGPFVKPKKRASDRPKSQVAGPSYQPNSKERAAIRNYLARRAVNVGPRVKVLRDGKALRVSLDHPDEAIGRVLLMEAIGVMDADFLNCLLGQLANAGSGPEIDETGLNFMLSVIKGAKPSDQFETMLAAQMAAIHLATMTFARRLALVETIPQQDSAERALNKLARTYATQMEALKRYRTGGEQKVTVQHVSVGEGGQAIVGNVTQAPPKTAQEKPANSLFALTDAQQAPMTIRGEPECAPPPVRRTRKDGRRSPA